MKTDHLILTSALLAMTAGCSTVSESTDGSNGMTMEPAPVSSMEAAPAPGGEMAPVDGEGEGDAVPAAERTENAVREDGTIPSGRFFGDLVLEVKKQKVMGAGAGETIIDGDLILTSQCDVSGMTVTGDVIFTGHNAQAFVEYLGQVLDYGVQNRF